jgi:hypothetical protein
LNAIFRPRFSVLVGKPSSLIILKNTLPGITISLFSNTLLEYHELSLIGNTYLQTWII